MQWIVEPGFFASTPVRTALAVGAMASVVAALTGVYVLMRRQSFAGHALTDVATAGGSGASLAGVSTFIGFLVASVLGASAMGAVGVRRVGGRDLATGIVLGAATGLSALFLFFASTSSSASSTTQQVLFGSIFAVPSSALYWSGALSALALAALVWCRRPLLLDSINGDLAAARGVNVRRVGVVFLALLALGVSLAAMVLGSILATALLIGPAAAALRVGRTMASTLGFAALFSVAATWSGILLSYNSYYWNSSHRALPVSFFVVAAVVVIYAVATLASRRGSPRTGE